MTDDYGNEVMTERSEHASQKWQAWAAVAAVVISIGIFMWQQSNQYGAETVTLQMQGAEITSIQTHLNSEDVTLSSLQVQMAGISQQLADMKTPISGAQR